MGRESVDISRGQAGIGEQRDVKINGRAAYLVAVAKLGVGKVFGDVDHHVHLMVVQQLDGLGLHVGLRRPVDTYGRDAVVIEIGMCAAGGIDGIPAVGQLMGGVKKVGLLLGRSGRHEHCLGGYTVAHRNHGLDECLGRVVAYTANLAGRCHVYTKHRVGSPADARS